VTNVLADTSVWVGHFRAPNAALAERLAMGGVLMHPMVLGEVACGTPPERARTLRDMARLQMARQASMNEVLVLIDQENLHGLGCGLVDMYLLASTLVTPGAELWTLDKRLLALARRFGIAHQPQLH